MLFDIIEITDEELKALSVVQMKMLRTAQQKKDELERKADKELKMYMLAALNSGMKNSTLIAHKEREPVGAGLEDLGKGLRSQAIDRSYVRPLGFVHGIGFN